MNKEIENQESKDRCNINGVIKRLNIKVMYCKSGQGLMSYGYSFIQIGGYVGQSNDDVKKDELWDGDYSKGETVLDCRKGKCEKISKDDLKQIVNAL
jgi:hypothetical protein